MDDFFDFHICMYTNEMILIVTIFHDIWCESCVIDSKPFRLFDIGRLLWDISVSSIILIDPRRLFSVYFHISYTQRLLYKLSYRMYTWVWKKTKFSFEQFSLRTHLTFVIFEGSASLLGNCLRVFIRGNSLYSVHNWCFSTFFERCMLHSQFSVLSDCFVEIVKSFPLSGVTWNKAFGATFATSGLLSRLFRVRDKK
jgi:hypothetical protein